jgi:hypothetical protein
VVTNAMAREKKSEAPDGSDDEEDVDEDLLELLAIRQAELAKKKRPTA